ncbi:MAG: hypothetical protein IKC03_10845 [Oscillospiraceae bacterium]|nr:hypothetical protein [Oscillospiraceae bacterium]
MPNYKEMYLKLFRATEETISRLIEVQQECEEMYISAPEPEIKVIPLPIQTEESVTMDTK